MFVKKRKRKWPFLALLFPLILLSMGAGYLCWNQAQAPKAEVVAIKTWSRFDEMKRLNMLLQGFAIQSIADIPCTDQECLDRGAIAVPKYFGITKDWDEAGALQARLGSADSTFMAFDVTVDVLPRVDLILCWEYLCSLSTREIKAALWQLKKSGATFLLMRHYPDIRENPEKESGVFAPINWKIPPYNFPEPMIHIMENGEHGTESLALWNLENLYTM